MTPSVYLDLEKDPYKQNNIFNKKDENCQNMGKILDFLKQEFINPESIKFIISKKEEDLVKEVFSNFKI